MTKEEIESVGWSFMDASEALLKYPLDQMKEGYNKMKDGEEVYMVKAPALECGRFYRPNSGTPTDLTKSP